MKPDIVFYQPIYEPQKRAKNSGTILRPEKMKEAFKKLGFNIIDINGSYSNKRKKTDQALKLNKIDFVYCESANCPLCISGKNHLEFRPFADLRNMRKLKTKAKLGFYYRDIFWKESTFLKEFGFIKGLILKLLYRLEFIFLIRVVDILFVQSEEMMKQFPRWKKFQSKYRLLPPGCEINGMDFFTANDIPEILYSGACDRSTKYNIEPLIDAAAEADVKLTINSDKGLEYYGDLKENKKYESNIFFSIIDYTDIGSFSKKFTAGVIWLSGKDEDICKYLPIKLFHYLSLGLPIIAKKNTAAGIFTEKNRVGWTFGDYSELISLLKSLQADKNEINHVYKNVLEVRKHQTWLDRALYVREILSAQL